MSGSQAFPASSFVHLLSNLCGLIDKGEKAGIGLEARLITDMYDLSQQVRLSCFHAVDCVARLSGKATIELPEIDTFAAARQAISDATAFVASLAGEGMGEVDGDRFELPVNGAHGVSFVMSGTKLAEDWSLPQVYFHVVTAYCILRHAGVPLGVHDFMAHMQGYMVTDPSA